MRGISLVETSRSYSRVAGHRLLIVVASLVAEHGLQAVWASVVVGAGLWSTGLIAVAHGLSCSRARRASSWIRD